MSEGDGRGGGGGDRERRIESARARSEAASERQRKVRERLEKLRAGNPPTATDVEQAEQAAAASAEFVVEGHRHARSAHLRAARTHQNAAEAFDRAGDREGGDRHRQGAADDEDAAAREGLAEAEAVSPWNARRTREESITDRMAAAALEMQDQDDPTATVKSAVALLIQNVEGCDSASISLVYGKQRVETPAASDALAVTGDRLQVELGEGPALDTLRDVETVYVPDLAGDTRWSHWGQRLSAATEARSVLTFRLFTIEDIVGALSMYSTRVDGFTDADQAEGLALAAHIAIAVIAAQRIEQFEAALDSRTIIAQACGLVMERYNLDAVHAFALLTRLSSTRNIKMRDIAAELVLTRVIPTTP